MPNQIPKSGEDVNLRNPTDTSYVFGGAYAPLTVKIVEYVSDLCGLPRCGVPRMQKLRAPTGLVGA